MIVQIIEDDMPIKIRTVPHMPNVDDTILIPHKVKVIRIKATSLQPTIYVRSCND